MARKPEEPKLWQRITQGGVTRYARVKQEANGVWSTGLESKAHHGSYYLRYRKDRKRLWESVGANLKHALNELTARYGPRVPNRTMVAKLTTVSALLVSELTGFVAKQR
jgi:hypothetical protein